MARRTFVALVAGLVGCMFAGAVIAGGEAASPKGEKREVKVQWPESTEGKGEDDQKAEKKPSQKTYVLPEGIQIKEVKLDSSESSESSSELPTFEFYPNGGSNGGTILLDAQDRKGFRIKVHFLTGTVMVEGVKEGRE